MLELKADAEVKQSKDTFGCELTLLDVDTHQTLQDPIQEDLWWNTQFHLVVQDCFQQYDCKEQIQGEEYEDYPKAIRVPANDTGILEAKAFFSVARLRHVKVDPGFHMIDRQAWRYCHSLQIVKLPDTVVAIEYAAFQGCCTLVMVEMPGCVELGVRLFSECCALEKVGVITEGACRLAIGAVVGPYAFEECAKLRCQSNGRGRSPSSPLSGIPQGCFQVVLGGDATFIGHRAYENCKLLTLLDISSSEIDTLHMHMSTVIGRVRAPGCKYFGICAFEECCSLAQIGDQRATTNQLAPQAQFSPRAFEKCSVFIFFINYVVILLIYF